MPHDISYSSLFFLCFINELIFSVVNTLDYRKAKGTFSPEYRYAYAITRRGEVRWKSLAWPVWGRMHTKFVQRSLVNINVYYISTYSV